MLLLLLLAYRRCCCCHPPSRRFRSYEYVTVELSTCYYPSGSPSGSLEPRTGHEYNSSGAGAVFVGGTGGGAEMACTSRVAFDVCATLHADVSRNE